MQLWLEPLAHRGVTSRRLRNRNLLVWTAVTLLAVGSLVLAMVLANLALEAHSQPTPPTPPPKPPMEFAPPGGHPMAQ